MRILFLSPRQCWPALSGAKLREYHFLRALGERGAVTYLYFADAGVAPLSNRELPFCRRIEALPKPQAYSPGKIARGLFGRWPLPLLNYYSGQMAQRVAAVTANEAFDLVHLDSIHMAPYVSQLKPGTRVVYNWHNIESEAMRRYGATVDSLPRRTYAALTARKIEAVERESLKTSFGHIVCSERERVQLSAGAPQARIAVIDNGVDSGYFGQLQRSASPQRIIFVGTMNYYPNVEAAVSFTREIWPRIRARLSSLTFSIVGAHPTPEVLALRREPGVEVTGTVPDVRPFYADAAAAIVPLRTGGGTRLKILEAMAAGIPVLSTPLGAEGLAVEDGRHLILVEAGDAGGWERELVKVAESRSTVTALTAAAGRLVRDRYDWTILGNKLVDTYADWLGAPA